MDDALNNLIEPTANDVTYNSYLRVRELISLQNTQSDPAQHDETLFIIIHQVYELWFKQILHELVAAEKAITNDQPILLARGLNRVRKIQEVLTHQVDILETMTPTDFNHFRSLLRPASGFQSHQFRLVEFKLGAKDESYLKFFKEDAQAHNALESALLAPSLYDHFLALLHNRGHGIPESLVKGRDFSEPRDVNPDVVAAFKNIYENNCDYPDLYMVLESLMDVDEYFLLWRYRHVAMVERMIGQMHGTGGSSGAKYLATTLSKRFFPEIWALRNELGKTPATHGQTAT